MSPKNKKGTNIKQKTSQPQSFVIATPRVEDISSNFKSNGPTIESTVTEFRWRSDDDRNDKFLQSGFKSNLHSNNSNSYVETLDSHDYFYNDNEDDDELVKKSLLNRGQPSSGTSSDRKTDHSRRSQISNHNNSHTRKSKSESDSRNRHSRNSRSKHISDTSDSENYNVSITSLKSFSFWSTTFNPFQWHSLSILSILFRVLGILLFVTLFLILPFYYLSICLGKRYSRTNRKAPSLNDYGRIVGGGRRAIQLYDTEESQVIEGEGLEKEDE